jgi:hypothetical protein
MVNENSKISYFNTLIFTIVAGIISLLLLLALFFEVGRDYAYLIVMVEFGIFSIIGVCIYQIIVNEARIAAAKTQSYNKISFQKCPDYFQQITDANNASYCKNGFNIIYPDSTQKKILIYPSNPTSQFDTNFPQVSSSSPKYLNFPLYATEQSDKLKNAKDQCGVIMKDPLPTDTILAPLFTGYSQTPWSYARARCEQYVE